jgi:hypothetical protein
VATALFDDIAFFDCGLQQLSFAAPAERQSAKDGMGV